ncbi:hypothetical protein DNL40_04100 [Xylanimonas oleitrophica]|uniref:Flagellar assembly protein FliH/Type III secretion system HrpE domain-containing protein n=1 Tax=Xylanimonas oleitrophica TaxID=2607479 RepID=A0A2W5XUV2_9MICO|nr:FliH/SctL family protein [Xylanimonas oleitrophica]PZR54128.1 hypothetical protein DNL40_04100 [Xylanimonas oleitrophica]
MSPEPSVAVRPVLPAVPDVVDPHRPDAQRGAGWAAGYAAGARRAAEVARQRAEQDAAARAAADARHAAEVAGALRALAAAAAGVRALRTPVVQESERTLHTLALELAEAVLGVELSDAEHGARAALARALSRPWDDEGVTVRMHPDDLALVHAATGADASPEGVRVVADPTVARGDAVAEHVDGWLDARIGTALERARAALDAADGAPVPEGER